MKLAGVRRNGDVANNIESRSRSRQYSRRKQALLCYSYCLCKDPEDEDVSDDQMTSESIYSVYAATLQETRRSIGDEGQSITGTR